MQVLVALARANGEIVSRSDLTASCWENRVVGDDAINRVMSRLRRIPDGIGKALFESRPSPRSGIDWSQLTLTTAPVSTRSTATPMAASRRRWRWVGR
jgi:DNA-binding winged helix-turn-helix (wHTH) protein